MGADPRINQFFSAERAPLKQDLTRSNWYKRQTCPDMDQDAVARNFLEYKRVEYGRLPK